MRHLARIEHQGDKRKSAGLIARIYSDLHRAQRQNVSTRGYRASMDVGVIVYCSELQAPGLRETARQVLEAQAARFGVSLGRAEVLRRRARGGSTVHVMAAGDELVRHLAAIEADPLGEDSPLMVLARAGALALVSMIEAAGSAQAQPPD
jgi:hypothetical protein